MQGFLKVETKSAFTAESAKNAEKNLKNSANPAFSAVNFWYSTNLRKPWYLMTRALSLFCYKYYILVAQGL